MANKRMIWKRVSNSRKVNRLSLKAAFLWTWAIPWFDVKGYLEVEADIIKDQVVPRRNDFDEDEIPGLITEIFKSGLWIEYELDGKRIAFDPKFREMQTVREDHETKSLFDGMVKPRQTKDRPTPDQGHTHDGEIKIRVGEVKGSEIKGNKDKPDNGAFSEKLKEAEKNAPTCKEIEKLALILRAKGIWNKAPDWARMKLQLQMNPEAVLLALNRVNEYNPKPPEPYAEKIISIESGNFYEREAIQKHEALKKSTPTIGEALKGALNGLSREMPYVPPDE